METIEMNPNIEKRGGGY